MKWPAEHDPAPARPDGLSVHVGDEPNFEAVFTVPSTHRLVAVRSRSRGGLVCGIYWEHEEYDEAGRLAARYESCDEMTAAGERRSGWRKHDPAGRLVASGDDLG